jgi:hypothetical protein
MARLEKLQMRTAARRRVRCGVPGATSLMNQENQPVSLSGKKTSQLVNSLHEQDRLAQYLFLILPSWLKWTFHEEAVELLKSGRRTSLAWHAHRTELKDGNEFRYPLTSFWPHHHSSLLTPSSAAELRV